MKKGKTLLGEFKEFIMRGNVLDMAVGVIIGGAFGKITTSLVNDVLMPFITWLFGATDMSSLNLRLTEDVLNASGEVATPGIVIGFGTLIGTVIDFLLVALVIFAIVKAFNKAHELAEKAKKKEEEEAAAEPEEKKPTTEELLADILTELKKKQ